MDFKVTCPNCGKKHHITEWDNIYGEEDENYRSDPHLCWDCYRYLEDMRVINSITNLLDSLNESQRDKLAEILGILSTPSHESSLYMRIIKEHFRGEEGIKTWGLW